MGHFFLLLFSLFFLREGHAASSLPRKISGAKPLSFTLSLGDQPSKEIHDLYAHDSLCALSPYVGALSDVWGEGILVNCSKLSFLFLSSMEEVTEKSFDPLAKQFPKNFLEKKQGESLSICETTLGKAGIQEGSEMNIALPLYRITLLPLLGIQKERIELDPFISVQDAFKAILQKYRNFALLGCSCTHRLFLMKEKGRTLLPQDKSLLAAGVRDEAILQLDYAPDAMERKRPNRAKLFFYLIPASLLLLFEPFFSKKKKQPKQEKKKGWEGGGSSRSRSNFPGV